MILNILYSLRLLNGTDDLEDFSRLVDSYNDYIDRLARWVSDKNKTIYTEDSRKKSILLILPSDKQFKRVRGRWESWLWRSRTQTG